ncbi:MAG: hypothetical protein H7A09_08710 [Oceanospirillaceae bacterium]|nr:hypothetical protein [Oceanospirillaceae bacterium]MCP5336075.1 hypothetical protein [Oceanospirillaceae bacterium]
MGKLMSLCLLIVLSLAVQADDTDLTPEEQCAIWAKSDNITPEQMQDYMDECIAELKSR